MLALSQYKAFSAALKVLADCVRSGREMYGWKLTTLSDMFWAMAEKSGRDDGRVDYKSFSEGLKRLGIGLSPQDQRTVFIGLDMDGDGSIGIHEFTQSVEASEDARINREKSSVNKAGNFHDPE